MINGEQPRIPIARAKEICERHKFQGVIILGVSDGDAFCITSAGKDLEQCVRMKAISQTLADMLMHGEPNLFADGSGYCHKCGCTEMHSCDGGCSWADEDMTLCTACVKPQEKKS